MITRLQEVIVPEKFAEYVTQRTMELSAFVQSGIVVQDALLNQYASQGGDSVKLPFFNPLANDDDGVITSQGAVPVGNITANKQNAVKLMREHAWGSEALAGALAGASPLKAIAEQTAKYWALREQASLISILNGSFATALASTHMLDISGESGSESNISTDAVIDANGLLGDAQDQIMAIAMHSAVYNYLRKLGAIEKRVVLTVADVQNGVELPYFDGKRVIIDDGLPVTSGVYTTYLFKAGAILRGDGTPVDLIPVEVDRDAQVGGGTDYLINRNCKILHPQGLSFTGNITGATPTNAELATGANWTKVFENKAIGVVALKHKINQVDSAA